MKCGFVFVEWSLAGCASDAGTAEAVWDVDLPKWTMRLLSWGDELGKLLSEGQYRENFSH